MIADSLFLMHLLMRILCLTLLLAISACTYLKPYQIEVNQGNYITQAELDRLKVGLSRAQVRSILGTPLTESIFHQNRWDYSFTLSRRGESVTQHQVSVVFEDDKLKSWSNTAVPSTLLAGREGHSQSLVPQEKSSNWWQSVSDWWKK
ncbi:MAG: hypothetical protein RLZZ502_194 [Pseudomonadota bacterium]